MKLGEEDEEGEKEEEGEGEGEEEERIMLAENNSIVQPYQSGSLGIVVRWYIYPYPPA